MEKAKSFFAFLGKKEIYGLALIILISIIIYCFGRVLIEKIITSGKNNYEKKKRRTIINMISNIFKYGVVIFAIIFVLDLYGVNTKGLFASLGIIGAVLGLALQDALKDFIVGITLITDNYFVVGDIIKINDFTGEIIDMGLRTTKIKKISGEVLIIANRNIDNIINLSQKQANLIIEIPTAYEEKVERVEKVIEKIIIEIKKMNGIKQVSYLGISELGESAVKYTMSITCPQENQWQTKRDILRIVKTIYDKEKIKIPYKQIEVHHE